MLHRLPSTHYCWINITHTNKLIHPYRTVFRQSEKRRKWHAIPNSYPSRHPPLFFIFFSFLLFALLFKLITYVSTFIHSQFLLVILSRHIYAIIIWFDSELFRATTIIYACELERRRPVIFFFFHFFLHAYMSIYSHGGGKWIKVRRKSDLFSFQPLDLVPKQQLSRILALSVARLLYTVTT